MSKQQPNMQRKQVASLELDDELDLMQTTDDDEAQTQDNINSVDDADLHEQATGYLKRGFDRKQIADRLVNVGLSRPDAHRIADKVWKENLSERRTNANILLGTGAFFVALWVLFTGISWLQSDVFTLASPALILLIISAWWFFKAWEAYRKLH